MGINASRLTQKSAENLNLEKQAQQNLENATTDEKGSIPSTPILTPKIIRENIEKEYLDPRSPSRHIARTPIELIPAAAEKLKALTLENAKTEVAIETPLKRQILLGIDPRSPTLEFQRTPIVVSASPDKKYPEKIRNKNLDKVLKCALPNTPKGKITPPKLLESCPVTPKPKSSCAYRRKSFVLLETNVDFTETDLDNVIKEKYLGKSLQNLYIPDETSCTELNDPRSPTIDFLRTPIQLYQKVEEPDNINTPVVQNEVTETCVKEMTECPNKETSVDIEDCSSINIDPEPILPISSEDNVVSNIPIIQVDQNSTELELQGCDRLEEETGLQPVFAGVMINEILLNDPTCVPETTEATASPCKSPSPTSTKQKIAKSAPVSPPSIVSVTPKKSKSQPVTPPFIDLTADVKELDKKLTHLIYEDERDLVVCPRIVTVKDQNRTPLGLRNGTETKKKSIQKLKVSDKPRKAEYTVSRIPVFKEKKIKVQCENTPPRGMSMRPKKSQWDAKDDTMVI